MNATWYAHLPGVELEVPTPIDLVDGRLEQLSFQEWSYLDDVSSWSRGDYEKSAPIFFVGQAVVPDDLYEALDVVGRRVDLLYHSLLLAPHTPIIPNPRLSVIYLEIETREGRQVARQIGVLEREWIVFGSRVSTLFDEPILEEVRKGYRLLAEINLERSYAGVPDGLDTLERTARPDFWWTAQGINRVNEFIHCMAALEHILLPARKATTTGASLNALFGRHAAVLATPAYDGLEAQAETLSALYRLRSRLIHGEAGIGTLSEEEEGQLGWARSLLRHVLLQAMFLGPAEEDSSLSSRLSQAYRDAGAHKALWNQLGARFS